MGKYLLGCAGLLVVGIIILVVIGGAMWADSYNKLVAGRQGVDAKWAEVENQYQRRADLIPNLVQTVSGVANFEKQTLTEVTNARASVGQVKIDPSQAPTDPAQLQKFEAAQNQLGSALSRLLVVSENYPNLKANQNFLDLQAQLEGTENRITTARNYFNQAAQSYNTTVQSFPTNLIAGMSGFTIRPYFSAKEGTDTPPAVHFDFNNPTNAAPAPAH
jgi:LemA protein